MSALLSRTPAAASPLHAASRSQWTKLALYVGERLGLDYPSHRHADLARAFAPAARALGFNDPAVCIDWLLAQPPTHGHQQVLAQHLAVGETYFFRDPQQLRAVAEHVLAPLISSRRHNSRHLRLWSAACSTGEEAYTLAMQVRALLSEEECPEWQLEITGTDLRAEALAQAAAGVYGPWSFRGLPQEQRQRYFRPAGDGRLQVGEEIRRHVRFGPLNLVHGLAARSGTDVDLIVCRNVLMYFAAEQARRVVADLRACLREGGWLVVGAAELPDVPWAGYVPVLLPGAVLLRKCSLNEAAAAPMPMDTGEASGPTELFDVSSVRALADQGRSDEALVLCERWLHDTVPDAKAHYLHALILQEHGASTGQIQAALQSALQCDDGFVLAHFGLGDLARREACGAQAHQHFAAVQRLLRDYRPEQPIEAGEGLTAAALAEMVATLALREQVS